MKTNKKSNLGIGMVVGAVAGAVAGLFLAPKSGKELRKDVAKTATRIKKSIVALQKDLKGKDIEEATMYIFGRTSTEAKKIFAVAQKEIDSQLTKLKKTADKIDKKKYSQLVTSAVKKVQKDKKLPDAQLKKLASYLEKDFHTITDDATAPARKAVKKAVKATKKVAKKIAKK